MTEFMFPPIKDRPSVLDQALKIQEEAGEILAAISEGRHRIAEEAVDTIHACETLIRQLGVDYDAVVVGVIEKNRARGYYAECYKNSEN